ncbi:MAG: WhiB family transcriptional regulator, partial [Candidatus Saccharimonadales bacterium]
MSVENYSILETGTNDFLGVIGAFLDLDDPHSQILLSQYLTQTNPTVIEPPLVLSGAIGVDGEQRPACRDANPDIFFPSSGKGENSSSTRAAKLICAGCVMKDACLETAQQVDIEHGAFG